MQCIEKLKQIGLHEVNAKTKIAIKRLDDIFECRFDNIDRIRLKGFLYILQREYKIDMSEWLEKYDEYHKQQEELNKENEEIEETKPDNINISFIDTTIENKTYKRLLIVFIILLILFIAYFIYNNSSSKKSKITNKYTTENPTIKSTPIVESTPIESNATIEYDPIIESKDEEIVDSNATIINEENGDITQEGQSIDKNDNIDNTFIDSNNNINAFGVEEVIITPQSPLWVGIIDLQTYKKKQVSIADAFSIKLDDSKIIRTGHGYFDIKSPTLNKSYIGGNSKYFIYTRESGFKEITKEEFLEFNRGQEW